MHSNYLEQGNFIWCRETLFDAEKFYLWQRNFFDAEQFYSTHINLIWCSAILFDTGKLYSQQDSLFSFPAFWATVAPPKGQTIIFTSTALTFQWCSLKLSFPYWNVIPLFCLLWLIPLFDKSASHSKCPPFHLVTVSKLSSLWCSHPMLYTIFNFHYDRYCLMFSAGVYT